MSLYRKLPLKTRKEVLAKKVVFVVHRFFHSHKSNSAVLLHTFKNA